MHIKGYDEPLTPREKQSLKMDKARKEACIKENDEVFKKYVLCENKTVFILTGDNDERD